MNCRPLKVSRRSLLQVSGVAALATGAGALSVRPAHAATANSLFVGGEGSTKAFGRTAMPSVTGDFRISFDYLWPSGSMNSFSVFSSFDGSAYVGPRLLQTGDRLSVLIGDDRAELDQALTPDQWHRFVLEFSEAGTVTIFVDGLRQTAGSTTEFAVDPAGTYSFFGYLGDLTSAGYNGTAHWDNLQVIDGDEVTFTQTFDDGTAPDWTQTSVGGAGVFGLASPAADAEVVELSSYAIEADVALVGLPTALRVAGQSEADRGVWVDGSTVSLSGDSAALSITPQAGGYFEITGKAVGTTTVTATLPDDETLTAEIEVAQGEQPGEVAISIPRSVFVGDHVLLRRVVTSLAGDRIDPADLSWEWSASDDLVSVDDDGVLHATEAGTATVTASATGGGRTVTAELEVEVEVLSTVKTRSTYWTPEKLEQAATNIAELDWAAGIRDTAAVSAAPYLDRELAELWALVPSQKLPRSYSFTSDEQAGCLNCGTEVHQHGQYPYTADVWAEPWKLTCPNCEYLFPTNDFAAYYAGGLDEYGFFDPDRARLHNDQLIADGETGNLVNVTHPDRGADWGVDDGAGTVLDSGARYTPVAYYVHWHLWQGGEMALAINALTEAYVHTREAKYAAAGIVLLDRVCDVYPDLGLDEWRYQDGYRNSNGNTNRGKAIGSIWETSMIRAWLLAADAFHPALTGEIAPEVTAALQYLDGASQLMDKTNPQRVLRNVEDGLLREILPAVKRGEIRGNNGMHQATLALAAMVLDHLPETQEMLDFNFASGVATGTEVTGGNLGTTFVDLVDRDGNGNEAAPGYNSLWLRSFTLTADYLAGYRLEGLPVYDLYSNPKYLKMFEGVFPLTMLGRYTPAIGDTAATGNPVLSMTAGDMTTAFAETERPIFAQVLHRLNGDSSAGLRLGIFDADPDGLADRVQAVVDEHGPWDESSRMLTGYGFAALRDGEAPPPGESSGTELAFGTMTVVSGSKPTTYFPANQTVQFEASTVGDAITFGFNLPAAVNDTINLGVWSAGSYGIYEVALDGEVLAEELSFAGSGAASHDLGELALTPGEHTITFTLVEAKPGPKAGFRLLTIGEPQPVELGTERGTTLYFGRNTGHGHRDNLNLDHWAYGLDLLPDLGYPRYANATDMHRKSLMRNTISHNTVVVDDQEQRDVIVSDPQLFGSAGDVQVVEVDGSGAYSATSLYHRTAVQIRIDDERSYVVDLFRTVGGSKHLYSFHSMQSAAVTTDGVSLTAQQDGSGEYVGSYAGPDVPYDDTVDDPTGFSYFWDVERNTDGGSDFAVTWQELRDTWNVHGEGIGEPTDVSVRLRLLGEFSDVALANCEPPQNKPGNPTSLRYLLARPSVQDESSVVTGVLEAFRGDSAIAEVEAVPVTTVDGSAVAGTDVTAVRVTLTSGRVDLVVHARDRSQTYLVDGHRFRGGLGVLLGEEVRLFDGTEFGPVLGQLGALTGTVVDFTRELSSDNSITVTIDPDQAWQVSADSLVGRYVHAENDGVGNAVFRIEGVSGWDSDAVVLALGTVSPVRAYADPDDLDAGFTYDLAEGRSWRIPLQQEEATDPAARMTELADHFASKLAAGGARQVATLTSVAARHAAAHRIEAAHSVVGEITEALAADAVKDKVGAAGTGWLRAAAAGWLAQLS